MQVIKKIVLWFYSIKVVLSIYQIYKDIYKK